MTTTRVTVAAVQRELLQAAMACAESARVTPSAGAARDCAAAARDLAEARRLLDPTPHPTPTERT